jgi:hypothetical protein
MELLNNIMQNLDVNEEQAKGGVGLIFKMAKDKLGGEFTQVKDAVPEADEIITAAPEGNGKGGFLKGLASTFGGSAGKLAGIAGLAGGFSKLGLEPEMVGKFIPVILNYVQSKGGDSVKNLLGNVLK